jgi:NAD(P)H-hydrate epimerase
MHLAVVPRCEPLLQVPLVGAEFDVGDAERIKPEITRETAQILFDDGKIDAGGSVWHTRQYNRRMPLPTPLYATAQVRALDAYAIGTLGVPGYTLMKRAGEAALRCLRTRWPTAHHIVIVCGGGNNGGDGYVLARFAQAAGLTVTVLAASPVEALRGDALKAWRDFKASGGRMQPFAAVHLAAGEVIVDALLGTGLATTVRAEAAAIIDAMNAAQRPVFALDVPSGLDSDRGVALGSAVRATGTMCFIALKTGLFVGDGPDFAGNVFFDDLEIVPPALQEFRPRLERITELEVTRALPPRARDSNKGDFGHVLIVGSGTGMPGAIRLAGEACLRVGAGLVTVAVAVDNVAAIAAGCPELICRSVNQADDLAALLEPADVVAIGPGLGQNDWARAAFERVLACGKPLVIDADALNLLAAAPRRQDGWILTPHPGEAGRLLGVSAKAVQQDRLGALDALVERYGGTVVLKGAGTLVATAGEISGLCERGNPGMATPGAGDVLTGTIAGILAQCRAAASAARVGVWVHAMAGDSAARAGGERGLIASDISRELRTWVNR